MPSYNTQVPTGNNFITIYEGTDLDVGAREVQEPISGRTVRHQTSVIVAGQLEFTDTPQISGVKDTGLYPPDDEESAIPIAGMGTVVIRTLFYTSNSNVTFKIFLYTGSEKLIGASGEHTVEADPHANDGGYVGNIVIFDNTKIGASGLRIYITDINIDTHTPGVRFYVGGF